MIQKKEKLLEQFEALNLSEGMSAIDKQKGEEIIAQFCLQCSRLFIQINQFLDESVTFKGFKFIYKGGDMQR